MSIAKTFVLVLAVMMLPLGLASAQDVRAEVAAVLDEQVADWNSGDIEGYLDHLHKGERTRHIIGAQEVVGFEAIRQGYLERNPDPEKLGRISYRDLDVTPLGEDAALAFAHWTFEIGEMERHGVFTLLFEKIDGRWLVTHDHTAFK
ncbi:MAG: nuclear transport factor 2 family protein [Parvularcula sp.]|jgi:ketosteroid isomerase-like protein|nr:nuclear transport factor 2 family protein [Parvularcula sp.]